MKESMSCFIKKNLNKAWVKRVLKIFISLFYFDDFIVCRIGIGNRC